MSTAARQAPNVLVPHPAAGFGFSALVFLRLLAVIHLIAFASAWVQIDGLIGPHGIAPANAYFAAAKNQLGAAAYWELPSLCWIFGTSTFLPILCAAGVLVSLLLLAGIAPAICLLLLWAGYLSLVNAGQMFFAFQWDGLLLEATLLAVFVAPWRWIPLWRAYEPLPLARWLVWWLLFRLMFFAGVVKLASGDTSWRDLTALTYHYETQPLPTPLAWYAHQMPLWWHKLECVGMFVIELAVPFFLIAPRRARHAAALILAAFMGAIALTGNYTFFNGLAIVLCLFCIDDQAWAWALRRRRDRRAVERGADELVLPGLVADVEEVAPEALEAAAANAADRPLVRSADPALAEVEPATYPLQHRRRVWRWPATLHGRILVGFAFLTFGYTGGLSLATLFPSFGAPPGLATISQLVEPLRSFNNYGLFAVMTHPRLELVIEGSYDGRDWHAYEFPAKPGDLLARPRFVAPYQPRLDWQMWFAALGSPEENPWLPALCEHLLRGTPEVVGLFADDPFDDRPPKYIRVVRYEYHFTDRATRARTGAWWTRNALDLYLQPMQLK